MRSVPRIYWTLCRHLRRLELPKICDTREAWFAWGVIVN
ncbi:hypothetical protein V6Z11_D06G032400 [Gossypium hirsutum]